MRPSEAVRLLSESGIAEAKHDARALFSHFGGASPVDLTVGDPECGSEELVSAIKRRAERVPLQYIIGRTWFYREEYEVSESCLIPRQDTEILVDYAVRNIPKGERFLDLCTGSGCIGISTLVNTEGTSAVLVDISGEALAIAGRNAERNGVSERAELLRLDVMRECAEGEYFAVLSNPPYVSDKAYSELEDEIFHEPRIAFVGGDDGADFYRHLTPIYKEKIKKNGFIAYEIGYDQADILRDVAASCGMTAEIIRDLSGNDRVAVLKNAEQ